MVTSVAFCVCQVSVAACPCCTVFGFAESAAVGANGGGGGGGGAGRTVFPPQPDNATTSNSKMVRTDHFIELCFTMSLPCEELAGLARRTSRTYLKLQLGCEFSPVVVSLFC